MTISITVSQCAFEGDGSSVTFPIADGSNGIYFTSSDEIAVTVDGATVSPSAYAVSGAGTDSGSITFTSAPADGTAGIIKRNTVITQGLSLTRGGYLSPTSVMESIDKLTRIDQDQQRQIDDLDTRVADAVTAAASATTAAVSATSAATSEDNAAASAAAAATSKTEAEAAASSAVSAYSSLTALAGQPGFTVSQYTHLLDDISGGFNGSETTFTLALGGLAQTPASAAQLLVFVGNSFQVPGDGYTVAGSDIVFSAAPAAGLPCAIIHIQIDTSGVDEAAAAAAASAAAASTSATNAASAAATASTNAATASTNAATATSASSTASTSATAAAASATAAAGSATDASASATAAQGYAAAAAGYSESMAWGYTFDSATTDADPGAAQFRFDNATFASATYLYISKTAVEGDLSALMAVWDDSSSDIKAEVEIRNPLAATEWWDFYIIGSGVDATTYVKFPITPVAASGSIGNGTALRLAVTRNGDVGTGAVDSFNGRSGSVVPASADYTASQITNTPAGGIAATTVQAALDELDGDKLAASSVSAFGLTLIDDANAAGGRATLDVASYLLDDISGSFNGATTSFALTQSAAAVTPRGNANAVVTLGGVMQIAGIGFTISGSNIVFATAPASGLSCGIQVFNA